MSVPAVEQMVPALVEVVEAGPELVELLLGDALAVPGQDLVLHLVDGPTQLLELNIHSIRIFENYIKYIFLVGQF